MNLIWHDHYPLSFPFFWSEVLYTGLSQQSSRRENPKSLQVKPDTSGVPTSHCYDSWFIHLIKCSSSKRVRLSSYNRCEHKQSFTGKWAESTHIYVFCIVKAVQGSTEASWLGWFLNQTLSTSQDTGDTSRILSRIQRYGSKLSARSIMARVRLEKSMNWVHHGVVPSPPTFLGGFCHPQGRWSSNWNGYLPGWASGTRWQGSYSIQVVLMYMSLFQWTVEASIWDPPSRMLQTSSNFVKNQWPTVDGSEILLYNQLRER